MSAGTVIVGGGLAGQRCAAALRAAGDDGPIRMVCGEDRPPYDRPPLSKGVLEGTVDDGTLALSPPGWHRENGVDLLLGDPACELDAVRRTVRLHGGGKLRYDRLLVATGSAARMLPGLAVSRHVHVLRTAADAERLRAALFPGARLVVIGAGFIGQEVAATARRLEVEVTMVEALEVPLAQALGRTLGAWFASLHEAHGVRLRLGARVADVAERRLGADVVLGSGERLACDAVVVGVGVAPATGWLAASRLAGRNGVDVDDGGATTVPGVWAAGDVARWPDARTGARARSEHWEAAARQGVAAARSMLGLPPPPPAVPSFWSDQYGLRVNWLGSAQGADALEVERDPAGPGLVALVGRRGRVIGALVAGRPRELPRARRLVQAGAPLDTTTLGSAA